MLKTDACLIQVHFNVFACLGIHDCFIQVACLVEVATWAGFTLCLTDSLSVYLTDSLCLSVLLSDSLCLSVSFSLSIQFSLSVLFSLCLSDSVSVCLILSLCV